MKIRCFVLSSLSLLLALPSSLRADESLPLVNPGFEEGLEGWTLSKEDAGAGFSQISTEAARSGTNGLRVTQDAEGPGSWAQSTRVAITGGKSYRLTFWSRCIEESGIGVWVQFFNAEGKPIPQTPEVAIQVPQKPGEWKDQQLDVAAPADAAWISFAVHSYSKRPCLADFDDFTLEPIAGTE